MTTPTTSPGNASSSTARSWPNTSCAKLSASVAPGARVRHAHPALEAARADPHERDAVAVARVHVGLDLEHQRRERRVDRAQACRRRCARGQRRRRELAQRVQQQPDAEVPGRRAEQQRDALAARERLGVERRRRPRRRARAPPRRPPRPRRSSGSAWPRAAMTICSGAIALPPVTRVERWKLSVARGRSRRWKLPGMPDRPGQRRQRQPERLGQVVEHPERLHARAGRTCSRTPSAGSRARGRPGRAARSAAPRRARRRSGSRPQSTAASTRSVSSEKSLCPGVSSRLKTTSSCSKRSTVERDRDPAALLDLHPVRRRRASAAARRDRARLARPRPAYSSSFSVSVVLPASGCEMIAKVRRRAASRAIRPASAVVTAREGSGKRETNSPSPFRC